MTKLQKQKPASIDESYLSSQNIAEGSVEYKKFCFDSTDVYIWNSKSLTPTIMSLDDSFLEDTFKQIEDYSKQKEENVMISTMKKPMNERTRGNTDEELESLAKDNLKILLETIEANNISSWIEDRLGIDDNESVEEEKTVNEFAKTPQRLSVTSQKCYANQTDKRGTYWSECQLHETLLNRKKCQHLS